MTQNWKTLHKDFRLNGQSYSKEELKDLGYGHVKVGAGFEKPIGNFLQDWLDENEAIKVITSGSTGNPKEILLKKYHMVNSALATGEYFDLRPGSSTLLCLPVDYIAGKMMLVRAMVLGLHLDYVEPSSNPLEAIFKEYDFSAMVPLQLENSFEKIDQIKTLLVGGAPVSTTLKDKLQSTTCQVFETYGMTETITHVAVKQIKKLESNSHTELVEGHFSHPEPVEGSVKTSFNALPNVTFSIDPRDCLVIDAPKISEDPVVTNDIVQLFSKTEFKWLGRYDNVINSGGVKLFPEQIEAKLSNLISNRFFVAGFPDKQLGQKLVLVIEGEANIEILHQKISELASLEKYEVPKNIIFLPSFLKTETGKTRRKETINLIEA